MDADHKRPLAAFVAVSATGALLLGQSWLTQSDPSRGDRPAVPQTSNQATTSSSPSGSPATGQVVEGITATPSYLPVKSIGPAPKLMARDDDGLETSIGAVRDPDDKPSPSTGSVRTRDKDDSSPGPESAGPESASPSETPGHEPSGGPKPGIDDDSAPGNSGGHSDGPKDKPPRGPRNDDALPPRPEPHLTVPLLGAGPGLQSGVSRAPAPVRDALAGVSWLI